MTTIEELEEKIRNKTITDSEILIYMMLTDNIEIPEEDDN